MLITRPYLNIASNDCPTLSQGYLIANGIKVNIDESSMKFLTILVQKYIISLTEMLSLFNTNQQESINKLVWQLGELDIIEIER